jgi:hypothetical protein
MDELEMFDYLVFDDEPQSDHTYDLDDSYLMKVIEILGDAVAGTDEYHSNPCCNTGAEFSNSVFTLRAYDWSENPDKEVNFKFGDVEVRWYKHIGRGCVGNKAAAEVSLEEAVEILNVCLTSLRHPDSL